jgi:hypothetical protein
VVVVAVMQLTHCRGRIVEQAHVEFRKLWRTYDTIVLLALSQRMFKLLSLPLLLFGGMERLVSIL